ncbi:MAG: DUF2723 domain-containing protein [Ignavibacteriales bacterium]|nr:DUF2723 domain-containing protein [Ignavibacteriales bacterium]
MKSTAARILSNEWFLAASVALLAFGVYVTTMCRTVSFIDAGELAAAATLLGIAHPTGYPLFTLVAHCALWIPIGGEEILRLNVLSSAIVAAAVGVFFRVLLVLARMVRANVRKGRDNQPSTKARTLIASAAAALAVGFSTTVWAQSVAIEVYGLHVLLILVTMLLFLTGIEETGGGAQEIPRRLFAAAFFLGLSFSNHLTTLLVVPALMYLYGVTHGGGRESLLRALKIFPFFCLGLSPYFYLPVRSSAHPLLDWGHPVGFERLFWHVSGKQYRSWMFSSFDSAGKQLAYFFSHFPSEYNLFLEAVMLFGLIFVFRSNKRIFWFLVVAFAGGILYSINYDIHDIDSYFLLAYLVAGIFLFFGIISLLAYIPERPSIRPLFLVAVVLLALPVSQYVSNKKGVSESDNFLVSDYVHNIFSNTERNAVILTYQWDYFVAPSLYFQFVRHEREDILVIDKELLRRSWYFVHLRTHFPWLIERSKAEVDAFLAELYKFEHDLPYDPGVIEARYVGMINSFVDQSIKDRPVYFGPEIEPEMGPEYARIPDGILFRLSQAIDTIEIKSVKVEYQPTSFESRLTAGLQGIYARMLTSTAARYVSRNQLSEASLLLGKALAINPAYAPARVMHERISRGVPRVRQ